MLRLVVTEQAGREEGRKRRAGGEGRHAGGVKLGTCVVTPEPRTTF
jgi:hypothetical protein